MTKPDSANVPNHVAIIMDGNRRWAKEHGLPSVMGHKKVVEDRLEPLIEHAGELGIGYITFWAWSTENWHRDQKEIAGIMKLFQWVLEKKAKALIDRGARVKVIGNIDAFPANIRQGITKLVHLSSSNSKITITFALNYGGHDELARAIVKMARLFNGSIVEDVLRRDKDSHLKASSNNRTIGQLDNSITKLTKDQVLVLLPKCLDTAGTPDPDLIIRTSGEHRLSGFMPWQSVYSELYFPDVLMPDFTVSEFDKAISEFQSRKRRFGR